MFLCQVSGKLSDFHPSVQDEKKPTPAWATITERRWANGDETYVKHYLIVPQFNEGFVQKCIEKDWKVIAFAENPREVTNEEARLDGYVLVMDLKSVQLP